MSDLLLNLNAFHFMRPHWLWLIGPVLLLFLALLQKAKNEQKKDPHIAEHLILVLTIRGSSNRFLTPRNLGVFALLISVFLLAGPTWQRQASPLVQDEAVLVIALDLSNTMNQRDIRPSRLERAKHKIIDLLKLKGDSRTALIAYAGSAHQVLPLSDDPELMLQFLDGLDTNIMPQQGKFPERVLPLAQQMIAASNAPASLLFIGDGVGPNTLEKFEQHFNPEQSQLLVLGVGKQSSSSSNISDDNTLGGAHIALQSEELKLLAAQGEGVYVEVSADKSDIERLNNVMNRYLANVEEPSRPWLDAGYYLLYPLALIVALWFRRGWVLDKGVLNVLLVVLVSLAFSMPMIANAQPKQLHVSQVASSAQEGNSATTLSVHNKVSLSMAGGNKNSQAGLFFDLKNGFLSLWLSPNQMGRFHFERGNYLTAANYFKDPQWRGLAFYYAENFSAAAEMFRQVESSAGSFNLATALAQGQHYVMAERAYLRILAKEPNNHAARKNQKLLSAIIEEIDQMGASQRAEEGEASRELGDAPQRSRGADAKDIASPELEQLSAEQLLSDQQIHEMWMRQVQADPRRFLRAKFQLQNYTQRNSQEQNNSLPSGGQ